MSCQRLPLLLRAILFQLLHNPVPYFVRFGKSYRARYFKLEPLAEINGKVSTAIGEVGILAVKGGGNQ